MPRSHRPPLPRRRGRARARCARSKRAAPRSSSSTATSRSCSTASGSSSSSIAGRASVCSPTRPSGASSATSKTCPSSARSSCPRSTAAATSRSRSRPAARRPCSRSGCATGSPAQVGLRARGARASSCAAASVGEADVRHVRRAPRLVPRRRGTGPRMSVALVGAGPGDPDLITVKGLARVRACDVLVYDRLVAGELVDEAPADALRIERDRLEQDEVNAAARRARPPWRRRRPAQGRRPVPLRPRRGGGARARRTPACPSRSSPACRRSPPFPASAGIPVTHRGARLGGHGLRRARRRDGSTPPRSRALRGRSSRSWAARVRIGSPQRLIEHGLPASTPAAVIVARDDRRTSRSS